MDTIHNSFTAITLTAKGVRVDLDTGSKALINALNHGGYQGLTCKPEDTAETLALQSAIADADLVILDESQSAEDRSACLAMKMADQRKLWTIQRKAFATLVSGLKVSLSDFKTGWEYATRADKSKGEPTFRVVVTAFKMTDFRSKGQAAIDRAKLVAKRKADMDAKTTPIKA